MKRIRLKEILLLLLPALILLGASFWWQKREQRDAVKESGPFRLEVAKIEKITPTPAEVAEGYDTKFLVTFAYRGKGSWSLNRVLSPVEKSVSVRKISVVKRNGKNWRPISTDVFPSVRAEGYSVSPEVGKMQAAVLVPLWKLPNKDLQLQLSLDRSVFSPSTPILAPTLSVPIRKVGEAAPNPQVSHEYSLSSQSAKVDDLRPVTQLRTEGKFGANRTVEFEVKTQTPWRQYPYLDWKMFNACIVDENGKIYRKWLGWDMDRPVPKRHCFDFVPDTIQKTEKPDVYSFDYSFSTAFIPASAGKLTFKALVSENGEWPLSLSVVVRQKDDWTLKRSRTLKLKSIETQPSPDDPTLLDVIVKTNYVGKQKPNIRLLIAGWSQRIESSLTSFPSRALQKVNSGYYPVKVLSTSLTGNEWEVIYRITLIRLKTLPKPLSFKADIGVEGDGFLPVSIPLPISKKP